MVDGVVHEEHVEQDVDGSNIIIFLFWKHICLNQPTSKKTQVHNIVCNSRKETEPSHKGKVSEINTNLEEYGPASNTLEDAKVCVCKEPEITFGPPFVNPSVENDVVNYH